MSGQRKGNGSESRDDLQGKEMFLEMVVEKDKDTYTQGQKRSKFLQIRQFKSSNVKQSINRIILSNFYNINKCSGIGCANTVKLKHMNIS